MNFLGAGLPGVDATALPGLLLVIEGADGSGRSTQIELLRNHLERRGFATVPVGLKRSTLVAAELGEAQQGNVLGEITRSLFYATDFADQLENRILPALRAGYIVLADRYVYTLMVRDLVRGADPAWVRSLYGVALRPDSVIYLRVSPENLLERSLSKEPRLDYWEAGMDLGLSRDIFESFFRYQKLIQQQFSLMQAEYDFAVVNGNRPLRAVARDIIARVDALLEQRSEAKALLLQGVS